METITWRTLCRLDEIGEGESKGFPPAQNGFAGLFAVRRGTEVVVYVNACPHIGAPLDWMPDQFLTDDKQYIICAVHGAVFEVATGVCWAGPCAGDCLEPVTVQIKDDMVQVPEDAGR